MINACQKNLARGIKAFKIRLGHEKDHERIANLRKIMGDEFSLMADANQRYSLAEAIKVIQDLAELNLAWIEEPEAIQKFSIN